MTKVVIVSVSSQDGEVSYSAVAADKKTEGKTAGEALDALAAQLDDDEANTLVIVQNQRPDRFFSAVQQKRLGELMKKWRLARDQGFQFSAEEQSELDDLVKAELKGSGERAASLVNELRE